MPFQRTMEPSGSNASPDNGSICPPVTLQGQPCGPALNYLLQDHHLRRRDGAFCEVPVLRVFGARASSMAGRVIPAPSIPRKCYRDLRHSAPKRLYSTAVPLGRQCFREVCWKDRVR